MITNTVKSRYLTNEELEKYYKQIITNNVRINSAFQIKKVIFNNPATIVYWKDGSKTVVKCQDGDVFDKEKGLAMAISKRALGDKGNYCNIQEMDSRMW